MFILKKLHRVRTLISDNSIFPIRWCVTVTVTGIVVIAFAAHQLIP